MTLNKWFITMALLFGSIEASASLKSTNNLTNSRANLQQAAVFYGEGLAAQYPDAKLILRTGDAALSVNEIIQVQNELATFERVMRGEQDSSALRSFQFVGCVPCGGGGGSCPRPVCYSNDKP